MGWSDPTFGCLRLANTSWGRSSPASRETLCLRSTFPASSEDKEDKRRKQMSIINKPPQHVKREYELEEPVALVVEKYATFIDSTPDHVVNSALKMLLWKDKHFMNWRKQQQQAARKDVPITATQKSQARA
jgi:hypothetical protein